MTSRSAAGKAAWKQRAPRYGSELRERIEHQAASRYAGWQKQRRPPAWFRAKSRIRAVWQKITERAR